MMQSKRETLLYLDARYEKIINERNWIVAAGHVDTKVVSMGVKPKPATI